VVKRENECFDVDDHWDDEVNNCGCRFDKRFSRCLFYSPEDAVYDDCRWFDGYRYCRNPEAIRNKNLYRAIDEI